MAECFRNRVHAVATCRTKTYCSTSPCEKIVVILYKRSSPHQVSFQQSLMRYRCSSTSTQIGAGLARWWLQSWPSSPSNFQGSCSWKLTWMHARCAPSHLTWLQFGFSKTALLRTHKWCKLLIHLYFRFVKSCTWTPNRLRSHSRINLCGAICSTAPVALVGSGVDRSTHCGPSRHGNYLWR